MVRFSGLGFGLCFRLRLRFGLCFRFGFCFRLRFLLRPFLGGRKNHLGLCAHPFYRHHGMQRSLPVGRNRKGRPRAGNIPGPLEIFLRQRSFAGGIRFRLKRHRFPGKVFPAAENTDVCHSQSVRLFPGRSFGIIFLRIRPGIHGFFLGKPGRPICKRCPVQALQGCQAVWHGDFFPGHFFPAAPVQRGTGGLYPLHRIRQNRLHLGLYLRIFLGRIDLGLLFHFVRNVHFLINDLVFDRHLSGNACRCAVLHFVRG